MMQNEFDFIVIGAGPAGLMAAISAAKKNPELSICVLEKGLRIGRKLLASGSGQCNITHNDTFDDFLSHYGNNGAFLKSALRAFSKDDLIAFLREQNIDIEIQDNGKIFPSSRRALDIVNMLFSVCEKLNVKIMCNVEVSSVEFNSVELSDGNFILHANDLQLVCKSLLIATGGASYKELGSTGDAIRFAESLGHNFIPYRPALTSIDVSSYAFTSCCGLSLNDAAFSIVRNGTLVERCSGPVLFTHTGLSGPGILDASRSMQPNDEIHLSFCGNRSEKEIDAELLFAFEENSKKTILSILSQDFLSERLAQKILEVLSIPLDIRASVVSKEIRKKLAKNLSGFVFCIKRLSGFATAMASAGGVVLEEINPKTMESKLIENLYFAGEAIDIDGDTGGYNIQAAFSMGYLAGFSVGKKNRLLK